MPAPESIAELAARLESYNAAYRRGQPIISDSEYDDLVERLRAVAPRHPFLTRVEPERFDTRREVRHLEPMLSIEKAYTPEALERYVNRVAKAAAEAGLDNPRFRVTPKLDGLAGRDRDGVLASRGNGLVGYDITNVFDKGVVPLGGRGQGLGEIVVVASYFETHLADAFEHPRNMVVGIVSSEVINPRARQALADGAVLFVPYSQLPQRTVTGADLMRNIGDITAQLTAEVDYPMDGMVAGVTDRRLRTRMGATAHHYRWQIAVKAKGATAESRVTGIQWQVGRTGNVTPVMEIDPVFLSGATIRRVSAHHAGMIRDRGIGVGARIEVIRSGEVIPKLERVVAAADTVTLPAACPSCQQPLAWANDFLKCGNPDCRAQAEQRISHWFKTLGSADWFGIKTIRKIVDHGHDRLEKVYRLGENDFVEMGFGPVQSRNLSEAIALSRAKPVEDWRFLAAFGIADLGVGDSRKLLAHIPLDQVLTVTHEQIAAIHGFGEVTSRSIAAGLALQSETIAHMLSLGFALERTPLAAEVGETGSPIAGKKIVFTGKMTTGSRSEMQTAARRMGASVQTAVSRATDYLVCGEKVGAKKIEKAAALGVTVLTEEAYLALQDKDPADTR
jgi:DNA ligase (NAD+)